MMWERKYGDFFPKNAKYRTPERILTLIVNL